MKRFVKYLFLLQAAVLLTAACGKSAEEEFPGNKGPEQASYEAVSFSYALVPTANGYGIWSCTTVQRLPILTAVPPVAG